MSVAVWWCGALSPMRIAVTGWQLRPVMASVLVAAIAMPWYFVVGHATDGEWLRGFLGRHNVNRFLEAHEGHSGGVYYYPIAILVGFAPWSVFLPMAVVSAVRRAVNTRTTDWGNLFAVVWLSLYVLFFTAAETKLPSYVLPAYPALAILTGRWFADWLESPTICPAWMPRASLTAGIIGGSITSGIAIGVSTLILPGEWWIGIVGLPLAVGCGIGLWRLMRGEREIAARVFVATTVIFTAGLHGVVSIGVDRHQISRPFLAAARQLRPDVDGIPVAAFDYFQSSLVFYSDSPVVDCPTPDDVAAFLSANPNGVVVTRSDQMERLAPSLPDDIQVLARKRLFLRQQHDALLLARIPTASSIQQASAEDDGERRKR
jgi:4-amino-4-deoxy-L-arabinose transferase-like glycosyltransferase